MELVLATPSPSPFLSALFLSGGLLRGRRAGLCGTGENSGCGLLRPCIIEKSRKRGVRGILQGGRRAQQLR